MPLFDITTTPSSPRGGNQRPPTMVCYETQQPEESQQQEETKLSAPPPLFAINGASPAPAPPQPIGTATATAPLFAINVPSVAPQSTTAPPSSKTGSVAPLFSIPTPPKQPSGSTIPPSSSSSSSSQQQQAGGPLFAIPTTTANKPEQAATPTTNKTSPLFALAPPPSSATPESKNTSDAGTTTNKTSPLFALAPSTTTTTNTTYNNCQPTASKPAEGTKSPLFALGPSTTASNNSAQLPPSLATMKPAVFDIEQGGTAEANNSSNNMPATAATTTTTFNFDLASEQANNIRKDNGSGSGSGYRILPKKGPSSIKSSNRSIQFCLDDDDDEDDAKVSVASIRSKLSRNSRVGGANGGNSDDGFVDDNASSSTDSIGSSSHGSIIDKLKARTGLMVVLIVFLGMGASAAFLAIGITGAQREQRDQFERTAMDLVTAIESQFERYVTAANYVHHYCRNRSFTRQDFKSLYEYLIHDGLDFKAVQFDPNVTREERPRYEAEARAYYAEHYPHINYRGFQGFDDGVENGLVPTSERDFYFPIHYMEPIIGNEAAIDLDYYSHISRRRTLTHCFEYGEPAITDRLLLVKDPNAKSRCGSQDAASYGVVLMHPGVNISDPSDGEEGIWPRDLSSIVLCIPALLKTATHDLHVASKVYIHDAAASSGQVLFLGGVEMNHRDELSYLDETEIYDVTGDMTHQQDMELTNKVWTITVVATNDTYKPNLAFVILGGVLVLLASVCLGLWVHNNTRRTHKFNAMKAKVEGEKAALILENTRQAARAERELNDFIAHEVRNPVAAAMAACSFVKSAVNEREPLVDPQKREDTREDVLVIYNSLQFVNDLLRNMLDMHRASHKQLQVNFETIDLYHDILQSTAGMIYQRDSKVKVIVECEPQNLHVRSDCLRLKQVILNLSRNASKFVNEGFIKLKGYVVDDEVRLAVEDSGIGIPAEKRDLLFAKFQESLDQLSQGTGIGLYLCKNLVELMGGEIFLDKNYNSGIPGNPGTSIIINLKRPPLTEEELAKGLDGGSEKFDEPQGNNVRFATSSSETPQASSLDRSHYSEEELLDKTLPDHLNVLFVDDDAILRKLFARSVKRVAPGWTMREASNGESALQLLDEGLQFDLIFVDQYMASIEKQLLGTETILEMRARGCQSRLFGLSANDLETEFIAAGADGFVIKPFPTETDALKLELLRAYFGKRAYYSKTR